MIVSLFKKPVPLGLYALTGILSTAAATTNSSSNCTNTPETRSCWLPGYDINTDYYTNGQAPPGKLVEYDLVASQKNITPDGYTKLGMVFNGQYPGPTIEANWGDTVRITVHNEFTNDNGTAVHWHGIRQQNANWQDGVPGVTQCPIKPGDTQVYEFKAVAYGTSWYHAHLSLQYSNGLYGPIVIHGPSSANYDVDLGPWLLSDWYHADVFSLDHIGITTNLAAIPDTSVLNGKGVYSCNPGNDTRCTGEHEYFQATFEKGTKYRIGLVNTASLITYTFYIDGHDFTVAAIDFVPIEPYTTDVLNIAIGQRYEIIIEANASLANGPNFWMHAQYCGETGLLDSKIGIVRYDATNTSDPPATPTSAQHLDNGCDDPEPSSLKPIVKQTVGARANQMTEADYFHIGRLPDKWPDTPSTDGPVFLWVLKDSPLYVNWSEPALGKLTGYSDDTSFENGSNPVRLEYQTGQWVYFVITANYSGAEFNPVRQMPPSAHPMHLHGHDFVILAQGHGPFDPATAVPLLDNPARRDTADVPFGGWIWIAFQVDNPGAWLFHCHIAFHSSDGIGIQYLEQPSKVKPLLDQYGVEGEFKDRCSTWSKYYDTVNIPAGVVQADSGV